MYVCIHIWIVICINVIVINYSYVYKIGFSRIKFSSRSNTRGFRERKTVYSQKSFLFGCAWRHCYITKIIEMKKKTIGHECRESFIRNSLFKCQHNYYILHIHTSHLSLSLSLCLSLFRPHAHRHFSLCCAGIVRWPQWNDFPVERMQWETNKSSFYDFFFFQYETRLGFFTIINIFYLILNI